MKFIILILFLSSYASAQRAVCESKSLEDKIRDCRTLMRAGFKEALMRDQGLMNAQLSLTAYKLAKIIYEKDIGEGSDALKKLGQELLNPALIEQANLASGNLLAEINEMYINQTEGALDSIQATIEDISTRSDELSDFDIAKIISQSNNENFNQNDVSMIWYVSEVSQQISNKESRLVSSAVKKILSYHKDYPQAKKEQEIAQNIAQSKMKLQGEIYKIKNEVFRQNKCDCVVDYNQMENAQNNSVLISCREDEDEIVSLDFMSSLHDILFNSPEEVQVRSQLKLRHKPKKVNSHDVRRLQDYLNGEDVSNLDRIVNFYKTGLYEDNGKCQTFTVVDKKNQTTSIYSVDGEKIFETNAIMAKPRTGMNQVVFNPDSELREFNNGTYSRATSAGVFHTITDMDPVERRMRKYDEEFNDRVFVLATRTGSEGNFQYDDKITIALHGVPINNYVSNANQRLDSFDGGNRNLSTGCVNIEGYAYDMINNLSQNHCPFYILPEDEKNYFHIKNRELLFSTDVPERKAGTEVPRRCQGVVSLVDGQTQCTGEWVEDPNGNVNRYYFSVTSTKKSIIDYKVGESSNPVISKLLSNRDNLIDEATRGQIDEEDFSDLAAMTYALSVGQSNFKSEETFKDLYNAFYRLRENNEINFERMNVEEKRMTIMGYYLDPSFAASQSNLHAPINRSRDIGANLELANRVRFIYEH